VNEGSWGTWDEPAWFEFNGKRVDVPQEYPRHTIFGLRTPAKPNVYLMGEDGSLKPTEYVCTEMSQIDRLRDILRDSSPTELSEAFKRAFAGR
jgi:hypothetical protein